MDKRKIFLITNIIFLLFISIFSGVPGMKQNNKKIDKKMVWDLIPGADNSTLPENILIRFQEIKLHGDGCSSNYRFLLFKDGLFFLQENKSKDCHLRPEGSKFNIPFSLEPFRTLKSESLRKIRSIFKSQEFINLKELNYPEEKVFDGSVQIIEYSYGKQKIKRVFSFQSASKEIEFIMEAIWKIIYPED